MRFNRRSLRFTLRPVHFPLYWQWVLIIFKPPLFTFSPFTWCLICTFLYHISHDCGSISHTKPKTMDDPTSLVSLDNSCGAGWLSAQSSYYSPRSRGRRGRWKWRIWLTIFDSTDYFRGLTWRSDFSIWRWRLEILILQPRLILSAALVPALKAPLVSLQP